MSKHLDEINNDYIRYSNCWEDADLLLSLLDIKKDDKVLSIGSAGDNSFSLLSKAPKKVVAVDVNPAQLHLIKLKKAAFQTLDHEEFISLLGFKPCDNRLQLFEKISNQLDSEALSFWRLHSIKIEEGIIHSGKFEKYFKNFRKYILPIIHNKHRVIELLNQKDDVNQQNFFNNIWNSWRWRTLFKLFFSRKTMGAIGRDPKFLDQVEGSVSDYILNTAKIHLSNSSCQTNGFLHYILNGSFGVHLPHYARKENFEKIKNNIGKFEIFQGYADDAVKEFGQFSKFNLSNIFEYMSSEQFGQQVNYFENESKPNSRFVYWNLMVNRNFSLVSDLFKTASPFQNTSIDKGFFYSNLLLSQRS